MSPHARHVPENRLLYFMPAAPGRHAMSGAARRSHGMVRIIGGRLRSRRIRFEATDGLRPTPDRVRETLFNWLAPHLPGARCLDLFAGSGALGFEAASRGAATVTLVEQHPRAWRALEHNRGALALSNVDVLRESAFRFLARTGERYDVIFCDPPFDSDAADRVLALLAPAATLADDGVIYLERRRGIAGGDLPAWQVLRHAEAGDVDFRLLGRAATPST